MAAPRTPAWFPSKVTTTPVSRLTTRDRAATWPAVKAVPQIATPACRPPPARVTAIASNGPSTMTTRAPAARTLRFSAKPYSTLPFANPQLTATADGATVAMRIGGDGVTWLASGLHGSLQLAINDATGTVSRERYLPFGQRRGEDDLPFTDRSFLGEVEDDSTGLTYLSARYYDPAIGRFITTDPIGDLRNCWRSF